MKKAIVTFLILAFCMCGCATFKKTARTIQEAAKVLCLVFATEQSPSDLDGFSPSAWCNIKSNFDPFIDAVLSAKQNAGDSFGFDKTKKLEGDLERINLEIYQIKKELEANEIKDAGTD